MSGKRAAKQKRNKRPVTTRGAKRPRIEAASGLGAVGGALSRRDALKLSRLLTAEAERAKGQMRIPGYPRPFFVSFLVRDAEEWKIRARYGSIARNWHERQREGFADVRVGSYRSDQLQDGGLNDNDKTAESYSYVDLPFGGDADGVRHGLWRLADARYRESVEDLLEKRSHEITYVNEHRGIPSFQRVAPVTDLAWEDPPAVDIDAWSEFCERTSHPLKRFRDVKDSHVQFEASHTCVLFGSSEGTRRVQTQVVWSLECYLWLMSDQGDGFPYTLKKTVADPGELPDPQAFLAEIRQAVGHLRELAQAPRLHSFCGPALLDPIPAGLLMHEALGHRLEGNRLLSSGEGQTFKGALGAEVLPEFLTLHDDPSLRDWQGNSLVGHYRFDDEGVTGQDARLIERGKLQGFLTSRTGIARRHRSNGHARGSYHRRPVSRMANLIVEAEGGLTGDRLREAFLELIQASGEPYGIRVIEATSGETTTDAYNFQAFLGEANRLKRVYPDGREEWVRGLNFVGTPLNAVRNIVAAGRRYGVDNAWCGAESGYVPVSTVSPALLLSKLEMQAKPDAPYTPYTYPIPWARPNKSKR